MKRLPLTPELVANIKAAVGPDVEVNDGFAVFESVSLNTLPLPGKRGSIFERATVSMLTLKQMSDNINNGNHLPLIHGHDMSQVPVGRVFKAGLSMDAAGNAELRTLWYVDPTEPALAAKIDAGSLDEVSVQFLASQILCSECGFDYRGEEADWSNFSDRTCNKGHEIGTDGVHVMLNGLEQFSELSLVTRGAASNPKILGKSQSKLTSSLQALAAKGFEVDELFLAASKGEFEVDMTAILSQLTDQIGVAATATAELKAVSAQLAASETSLEAANTRIAELEAATPEPAPEAAELAQAQTDLAASTTFLAELYTKLAVAAGETEVTAPTQVAELTTGIEKYQSTLTAILPVGGVAATVISNEGASKFNASIAGAFKTNR